MKKKLAIITALLAATMFIMVNCKDEPENPQQLPARQYSNFYENINMDKIVSYLVKDGKSDYKIVIPADPTEAELYAAGELSHLVQQSTGVALETVRDSSVTYSESNTHFSVGRTTLRTAAQLNTDYSSLNLDGFVIATKGKTVITDAANDRGFLYAVYDFAEKYLNVRFFTYDETYIPEHSEVPVYEMNVKSVPAFSARTYLNGQVYEQWAIDQYVARTRTNSPYITQEDKYGGPTNFTGIRPTHNMAHYVPASKWRAKHPEWYWDDPEGRLETTIDLTNGITDDGKLDESMEESVLKAAIEGMKAEVLRKPHATYFSFEQEDGNIFYLSARNTAHEGMFKRSGMLIRFCNVLADEVQKWLDEGEDVPEEHRGRQIKIVTFAYEYTSAAPTEIINGRIVPLHPTVVAGPNLVIRMAQFSNSYYPYFSDNQDNKLKAVFAEWKVICDQFMFWGYDTDYADYVSYFPSLQSAYDNVQGLKDYGMVNVLMQSVHHSLSNWQSNLKHYVYSKLLWNPDQDVSLLKQEYLNGYYGNTAAPFVSEFIDYYDRHYAIIMKENSDNQIGTFNKLNKYPYVTLQLVEKGIEIIERGEEAILSSSLTPALKEKYLKRLAGVKVTPLWMKLNNYVNFFPMAELTERRDFAKLFFDTCEFAGVETFSESVPISTLKLNYGVI